MMPALKFILPLFFLITASGEVVSSQQFYTEEGTTIFISDSSMETFEGTSQKLVGMISLKDSVVDFYVDLNTLDTGIKLRNEHMRENFLNTDKHQFASYYGKLVSTIEPGLKDTQEVRTRGTFSLHGEKKEIEVNGKAVFEDENTLYIEANWELNLHDYNIEVPKFLFLKVNEVQVIEISATLKPK